MPSALADILEADGLTANAAFLRDGLDAACIACMRDVLAASTPKLLRKAGYFDLLGCDFMVTTDNQLYLIEINTNPALSLDNSTLEKLLPVVVDDCIDIVLKCQGPERVNSDMRAEDIHLDNVESKFQLIFDEEKDL